MEHPIPDHHTNAETFKDEPIYIFTDKAVVPPPQPGLPLNPGGQEKQKPAADQRAEETT